jgi:hypothetical protein
MGFERTFADVVRFREQSHWTTTTAMGALWPNCAICRDATLQSRLTTGAEISSACKNEELDRCGKFPQSIPEFYSTDRAMSMRF